MYIVFKFIHYAVNVIFFIKDKETVTFIECSMTASSHFRTVSVFYIDDNNRVDAKTVIKGSLLLRCQNRENQNLNMKLYHKMHRRPSAPLQN